MTYFCRDCHEAFDEPSVKREWVGDREHGGYVDYIECPNCGSEDITDALICPNCGGFCGELFGDGVKAVMCEECINDLATEENLIAYGYEDKQSVEINGYLAEMFTPGEIESILTNSLKLLFINHKEKYIEDCKDNLAIYFAEMQEATDK